MYYVARWDSNSKEIHPCGSNLDLSGVRDKEEFRPESIRFDSKFLLLLVLSQMETEVAGRDEFTKRIPTNDKVEGNRNSYSK